MGDGEGIEEENKKGICIHPREVPSNFSAEVVLVCILPASRATEGKVFTSRRSVQLLFFSLHRSEGWPHHGRRPTVYIYPCPLSF